MKTAATTVAYRSRTKDGNLSYRWYTFHHNELLGIFWVTEVNESTLSEAKEAPTCEVINNDLDFAQSIIDQPYVFLFGNSFRLPDFVARFLPNA